MLFNVWCCTSILQSYTDSENVSMGPHGETYPAPHEADHSMNIKAKEGSHVEVEEDPVPISFQDIKAEPEVSCVCTVRQIREMCRSATCLSDLHLFLCM
jgi:hypothetical protein